MKIAFDNDPPGTEMALLTDQRSPVSIGRSVAEFVAREIATVDAELVIRLGFALAKKIRVDGRRDVALYDVKPSGGEIVAEWESLIPIILVWIAKTLDERSPIVSGDYQREHRVMADGVEFDVTGEIPQAREYVFFNATAYSRRIEIGKTETGRDFVIQVQPRIYQRTGKDAAARFGNVARISSEFITPPNAYTLRNDQAYRSFAGGKRRVSRRQRPDRVKGSVVNVPAIIVRVA